MAGVKITEIRVTAGADVWILRPGRMTMILGGKPVDIPAKLAATLFKAVAQPAEKFVSEVKAQYK